MRNRFLAPVTALIMAVASGCQTGPGGGGSTSELSNRDRALILVGLDLVRVTDDGATKVELDDLKRHIDLLIGFYDVNPQVADGLRIASAFIIDGLANGNDFDSIAGAVADSLSTLIEEDLEAALAAGQEVRQ